MSFFYIYTYVNYSLENTVCKIFTFLRKYYQNLLLHCTFNPSLIIIFSYKEVFFFFAVDLKAFTEFAAISLLFCFCFFFFFLSTSQVGS